MQPSSTLPTIEIVVARLQRAAAWGTNVVRSFFLSNNDPLEREIRLGAAVALALVVGLGTWSVTARLASAVVVPGTVVVDENVKKVQHPTGGVVGEIRVHDGEVVKAGDVVARLDETVTRANLRVVTTQLDQLEIREARLDAERDGLSSIPVPVDLQERVVEPDIEKIIAGEETLFVSRRLGREGQKSQLNERINQLMNEISGLEAQADSKAREIELIGRELGETEKLWRKNLTSLTKLTSLQREATRVEGEKAQLISSIAQAKAKIAETRLQMLQLDQDLKTEVMKDLRDAQAKSAELRERKVAAEDQLRRVDLKSPETGIVHQLAVHTVGGVVNAGEVIMLIVPQNEALVLEVKVPPQDIDHVHVGQEAFVRFTAFNQRTTPEFRAIITRVAADLTKEQQTGQTFYVARASLEPEEANKLGSLKLLPGMPAEVHIRTGEQTAMTYLLKPLRDQIAKAFREQ